MFKPGKLLPIFYFLIASFGLVFLSSASYADSLSEGTEDAPTTQTPVIEPPATNFTPPSLSDINLPNSNPNLGNVTVQNGQLVNNATSSGDAAGAATGAATCSASGALDPKPVTDAQSAISLVGEYSGNLSGLLGKWDTARNSCAKESLSAQNSCIESCSSTLQTAMQMAGPLVSVLSSMNSQNQTCSSMGNLMGLLSGALAAYQVECGQSQTGCTTSCNAAKSAGQALQTEATRLKGTATAICTTNGQVDKACVEKYGTMVTQLKSALQEDSNAGGTTVGAKENQCAIQFKTSQAQATQGMMGFARSQMSAQNCATQTAALPGATALDCTNPANANMQQCICELNPRLPGCPNTMAKMDSAGASTFAPGATPMAAPTGNAGNVDLGDNGTPTMNPLPPDNTPGAAPQSGFGGSPGGATPPPATDKAAVAGGGTRLNAGVLGGDMGGGGGGIGGFFGNNDPAQRPGVAGAKNQQRGLAAIAPPKYVTGAAGRSNWEKVSDRYKDARPTLLSNQ